MRRRSGHPRARPSRPGDEIAGMAGARQRRSPNKPRWCEPGTWGADFYRVAPQPGEIVITKYRYSGFAETNLDLVLRSQGIASLIMTGVASNNCVECTARDGFMRDYYIVFVDDCTAATNNAIHAATLANMESLIGMVVQSAQVLANGRRSNRVNGQPGKARIARAERLQPPGEQGRSMSPNLSSCRGASHQRCDASRRRRRPRIEERSSRRRTEVATDVLFRRRVRLFLNIEIDEMIAASVCSSMPQLLIH